MRLDELATTDAPAWKGLRLPIRQRLAAAVAHLLEHGSLRRADIQRLGEVSQPQASADISRILKRCRGLMAYDKSLKTYVLKRKGDSADSREKRQKC